MTLRTDIMEAKKEIQNLKEQGFAYEILQDYKKANKRLFISLIVVLFMWFATIGAFVYYINTTGYEETVEYANTDDGGNACVGENCNNGEINYGNSN